MQRRVSFFAALCTCVVFALPIAAQSDEQEYENNIGPYLNFETPQVHPIAFSSDGSRLFAVNTADARISVFNTTNAGSPVLLSEIPVGIEPVSVRPRTADEIWVVNHTSDSVSVVSVSLGIVTDTILCKDEPCDVVFAGTPQKAFVSVAGSREIRVFNATTHVLLGTIPVLGVQPRALAVSPDGQKVYAAVALSGNKTTILPAAVAPPQPASNNPNVGAPPQVGMIVDSTNPAFAAQIPYTVSDNDVAEIDANSFAVLRYFTGVGTLNFSVTVHPTSGNLFVACTDSRNTQRYEQTLRGHAVDNQISRIDIVTSGVTKFDLNAGISYANPNNPAAKAIALAQPTDAVFTPTASALYVAAFGTDRIGKIDPLTGAVLARIEIGSTPGATVDSRHKRGPRGLAMHPTANRLYVMNRISNTISIVNTSNDTTTQELAVGSFDPTPQQIREGRGFLYDAKLSGNGTMSCASCHIDAESDLEDWDLGDYEGPETTIPDPSNTYGNISMHPMKGPMFTQTLRGLSQGSNPLHWRGDRSNFVAFNSAFSSLMGGTQISAVDMQLFSDFIMTCDFEPNPNLKLDRSLPTVLNGGDPVNGAQIFQVGSSNTPIGVCNSCHHLPLGTGSKIVNATVLGQAQGMKVPQLRTTYQKTNFNNAPGAVSLGGFGFGHDGVFSTVEQFLSNPVTFGPLATDTIAKRDLAAFMMCIDTNTPPGVGYGRTVKSTNVANAALIADINTLIARANITEIDLIAKGKVDGALHGFLYVPATGKFQSDVAGYGPFTWAQLSTKISAGGTLTVMGVPEGSGPRMGVDRDNDGTPDGNEEPPYVMEAYGFSTPTCASDIVLSSNSEPLLGNSGFAFTCTHLQPNGAALLVVCGGDGLEPGPETYGITLWVDLLTPPVLYLEMPTDDLGFGYLNVPIPYNLNLADLALSAMVVTINPCAPFMVAGSHGIRFELAEP